MTRREAVTRLLEAAEDEEFDPDEAADLFAALYGRRPDHDDGDTGEIISLCYAHPALSRK